MQISQPKVNRRKFNLLQKTFETQIQSNLLTLASKDYLDSESKHNLCIFKKESNQNINPAPDPESQLKNICNQPARQTFFIQNIVVDIFKQKDQIKQKLLDQENEKVNKYLKSDLKHPNPIEALQLYRKKVTKAMDKQNFDILQHLPEKSNESLASSKILLIDHSSEHINESKKEKMKKFYALPHIHLQNIQKQKEQNYLPIQFYNLITKRNNRSERQLHKSELCLKSQIKIDEIKSLRLTFRSKQPKTDRKKHIFHRGPANPNQKIDRLNISCFH